MRILTALLLCCAFALHAADLSQYKTDKNSWTDALIQGIAKERTLYIKPGTYILDKAIEITKDIALIMEDGAKFMTDQKQMFVLKNGNFMIEGRGIPAELRSSATGDPRMVATDRASIIDLNNAPQDAVPSLEVRNVKFYAFHGIDGIKRPASTNKFGKLIVEKCQFFVTSYGVGIRCAEVGSARVENCLFEDVRFPIALSSPIHGGCIVRGNTLKRFGLAGIQLGKGGQISEGCTTHLSSAIVHDNQLLRGGIGEHEKASYTQGILVYGHNVSVQGNVVRDVYRGFPAPDRDFGRHYRTQDGKILTENWIYENGKRRNDKRGYINALDGKVIIPEQYEKAWIFSDGVAAAMKDGKIGFINSNNETVLPFRFDYAEGVSYVFKDGLCTMSDENRACGLIDIKGNWVLDPQFDCIWAPDDNSFRLVADNSRFGLMDSAFGFAFPIEYDWISTLKDGNYHMIKDGIKRKVSPDGTILRDFVVDHTWALKYPVRIESQMGEDRWGDPELIEEVANTLSDYLGYRIDYGEEKAFGVIQAHTGKIIIPAKYDNGTEITSAHGQDTTKKHNALYK